MSEHVIELNGRRYDAITGAHLGKGSAGHMAPKTHSKGRTIDGVMRPAAKKAAPKPAAQHPVHVVAPSTSSAESTPVVAEKPQKKVSADVTPTATHSRSKSPSSAHVPAARRPERAKTLMRHTVKKPEVTVKPAIKPQAPAEIAAKPASAALARKQSVASVDHNRMERAVRTPKHAAITRFHHEGAPVFSPALGNLQPATVPVIAVAPAPKPVAPKQAHVAHHPKEIKPLHPNIFEQALHHANSHNEPAPKMRKKTRRRLANTLAGVAAFLVIAGFVGYLNMPTLELKMASMQAGFSATMPGYKPTGYTLAGGVERTGGTVSMSFRSGANLYTITQQASDWNSQTLLDNTLALGGNHETVQEKGQTVYIYGDGTNATWVNGGVRYDLSANAELNKKDIVSIATSL